MKCPNCGYVHGKTYNPLYGRIDTVNGEHGDFWKMERGATRMMTPDDDQCHRSLHGCPNCDTVFMYNDRM